MGNSNSTGSGGGGGHHHNQQHGHHKHGPRYPGYHHPGYPGPGYDDGWSHSLETPEQRNRMKRGYFPPRAYIGGMPQPQKVLPVAPNPNKLLKATQNGAILHGGGTISGRKLGELELEIRKRSTVSCPGNGMENEGGRLSSGRSTPNLVMMPRMGLSAGLPVSSSSSRSRDYGSEPDLRDVGRASNNKYDDATLTDDRSSSPPVPNSFTIISESPAKKQIRSRKKSKAPPPPPNTVYPHPDNQPNPNFLIPYQYQLQQNPQRQLLLTPVMGNGSPLMGHDEHKNKQKIKSRLFKTKAESRSAMNSPALRVTPSPSNELNSRKIGSPQQQQRHPVDPDFKNKMRAPNPVGKVDPQIVPKGNKHNYKEEKNGKKTFYFGMDMGTFKQKQQQQQQQQALIEQDNMAQSQYNHQQMNGQNQNQAHVADLHKEISRRKMLQKLDDESRSSSRNSAVVDSKKAGNNNKLAVLTKPGNQKITANNRASESDSDGIHRRQDSGSFELNEKKKAVPAVGPVVNNNKKIMPLKKPRDQSSSDLSSSDLDVPLVVTRPTLPQKRPELPRFSPTAAWRAIDSPSRASNNSSSNGGRMSFEPDLSGGEDSRLHRFTRPSAPPRISAERSGDSGISAGDAGSPANAIPLLLEEEDDLHNPRVDYNDDFDDEFSSSSPHVKMNKKMSKQGGAMSKLSTTGIVGADRKMKCWTPEQDLDESSSDFDQDNDPILLPPVPPKPGKNQKPTPPSNSNSPSAAATKYFNLFHGKRASAVVSDSDSKYFGGGNSKFSSSDELNNNQPHRRFYGRSPAQQQNGQQKRFLRSPAANKKGGAHGFVGLDTNWFLSRSEPNSLNFIGIGGEEETRENNFSNYFRSKKLSVPAKHTAPPPPPPPANKKKSKQFSSPQIVMGRNNPKNKPLHQTSSSQDELECQIQLGDEDFDSYSSSDMRNGGGKKLISGQKPTTTTAASNKQSEIGYGPSNMNFNNNKNKNNSLSSSAYEDQEEELDLRLDDAEEDSEELMRDDLFDYLDQYEEGEFEKEQELGTTFPPPHNSKTTEAIINTTTVTINHHRNDNNNSDDNHNGSRPFSHHIMYLPSYDARKIFNQKNQNWRRTRSVDALDSGEKSQLFKRMPPPQGNHNIKIQNINQERIHHIQVEERNSDRKVSAPSYLETKHVSNVTIKGQREIDEEERRAQNKKKFKFQSTLRVQERRKMEEELSREADQREEERLREIEEMKRVEEEFQKKRRDEARARQEQEAQAYQPPVIVGAKKFGKNNNNNNSPGINSNLGGSKNTREVAKNNNNKQEYNSHHYKMMSQRQEPEGAPASVSSACNSSASPSPPNLNGTGQDLRKELISASKKRSGLPSNGGPQTQELSEYRQETRQYCDYRRAPQNGNHHRQQSPSPARFIQKSSSSSDIFPIPSRRRPGGSQSSKVSGRSSTTTLAATVHPEVVCDIPVKPHPYMVNASRLNGSNSTVHLLTSEDRPNSVLGSAQNLHQFGGQIRGQSSPSGRGGDNYRRDWAHHLLSRGGSSGLGGGRASSVMSLHSAPPMNSDNFRNSTSDLSRLNGSSSVRTVSPGGGGGYARHSSTTNAPSYRQYSASPPPSASPVPSSTTDPYFHHQMSEASSRASPVRMTSSTTVISIGPQMNNVIRKKPKSNKKGPPPTQALQNQAPLSPITTPPFQAQPYTSNNRTRGYRPVSFKPPQPTTTVN